MNGNAAAISPLRRRLDWALGGLKYLPRILLGIFVAGIVGIGCVAGRYASHFGLSIFRPGQLDDLILGVAVVSLSRVIAMIPGIFLLFILDRGSKRFRQARLRPLYAGAIGVFVIWGWSLICGSSSFAPPVDSLTVIFPIACFLSGMTFAMIVTFPGSGKQ
jgi:hypothetical protein